mmetsp:Transcript_32624/g.78411  ORF Transcript_32624/g.78411 Transcript_32624/m.78411 type:complete len:357 (-) Transcript_32624:640-1710(-)
MGKTATQISPAALSIKNTFLHFDGDGSEEELQECRRLRSFSDQTSVRVVGEPQPTAVRNDLKVFQEPQQTLMPPMHPELQPVFFNDTEGNVWGLVHPPMMQLQTQEGFFMSPAMWQAMPMQHQFLSYDCAVDVPPTAAEAVPTAVAPVATHAREHGGRSDPQPTDPETPTRRLRDPADRQAQKGKGKGSGASQRAPGSDEDFATPPSRQISQDRRTTVMVRNIPNKYNCRMLLQAFDNAGFKGTFDFAYLPIDFRNRCNVGYAFLNFAQPHDATRFWMVFNGKKLSAFKSNKVVEVTYARVQGLDANVEHFRNSAVMRQDIEEQYKPILFDLQTGKEKPFPMPTSPLPSVKTRPGR